jgi:hypothetical protein
MTMIFLMKGKQNLKAVKPKKEKGQLWMMGLEVN